MQQQAVPSLTRWGVSPTADLIYRALTTFGPSSVEGISDSLEIKTKHVRLALDELTALDAVRRRTEDRVWIGRPATHVVTVLRTHQDRRISERRRLSAQLTGLGFPAGIGDPARLPATAARPLVGMAQVASRMGELIAAERHEHLAMNPEPAFSNASVKASAATNRSLFAGVIEVSTLGVPASDDHESGWHDEELLAYGLSYRELPHLPTKLIIMDRATALLPLNPGNLAHGAWEISDPLVVEHLVSFFLTRWARAVEPRRKWIPPMTLNPRERAVFALLAAGHTDAAIAGKLDISLRTVAYTVSNLMERYAATNRFQLGLQLGAEAAKHELDNGDEPEAAPEN